MPVSRVIRNWQVLAVKPQPSIGHALTARQPYGNAVTRSQPWQGGNSRGSKRREPLTVPRGLIILLLSICQELRPLGAKGSRACQSFGRTRQVGSETLAPEAG